VSPLFVIFYVIMNRRNFLRRAALGACGCCSLSKPRTSHLIVVVMGGGVRKKEYLENESIAPNIRRLASEAFVFEEDHSERVASHDGAFTELLTGRAFQTHAPAYPTIANYIGKSVRLDSIQEIPSVIEGYEPRLIICREMTHDIGHESYEKYARAVNATDRAIGRMFDWVKNHPSFSRTTAIVIRPEFGRDDEVNAHGQLHHSYGFFSTHRVASIFWGPDFNRGIDRKTVINTLDMAPTLARVFGVHAVHGPGGVVPGLFS
jgi:arylsulfatase A-like enzyme